MIKVYSIPLLPRIEDSEGYAKGWLEDCLVKCSSSLKADDYHLKIENFEGGKRRAVFVLKSHLDNKKPF